MTRDAVWPILTEVFHDFFDDDEIALTDETTADDVEDWDSVSHVQLIVAIEERFGIKFKTGELAGFKNVGEMVTVIAARAA